MFSRLQHPENGTCIMEVLSNHNQPIIVIVTLLQYCSRLVSCRVILKAWEPARTPAALGWLDEQNNLMVPGSACFYLNGEM